jgi:hypothetical protein
MSEVKSNDSLENLSQEERMEMLRILFSTLEVDKQMEFAVWCDEVAQKGGLSMLAQKGQKMYDDLNSFLANAKDTILKTGEKIYTKTNEVFEKPDDEHDGYKFDKDNEGKATFFD